MGLPHLTIVQRIWRYIQGIVFGLVVAWAVSVFVAQFWPAAKVGVFVTLAIVWFAGFVQIVTRDIRAGPETERAVFADPEKWQSQDLPQEFRFITTDTTVQEVVDRVGPYSRVTEIGLIRYDLPSGGALFLYPASWPDPASKIRGVQLYRTEETVPIFS